MKHATCDTLEKKELKGRRSFTCIICPKGCEIEAVLEDPGLPKDSVADLVFGSDNGQSGGEDSEQTNAQANGQASGQTGGQTGGQADKESSENSSFPVYRITGEGCPRGRAYVLQELTDPRRTISTSMRVLGGEQELCSVRLTSPIPKRQIMEAVGEIHAKVLTAPVKAGEVVISSLLGLSCDVIATKDVNACREAK